MAIFSILFKYYQMFLQSLQQLAGIAPLLFRLYLAPVLIQAGWNKYSHFADTVAWFGNADWGLGLPMPWLLAFLAVSTEIIGGFLLLIGLFTRLVSLPLIVTMLVAIFTVHWPNGWLAIADANSWLANGTILHTPSIMAAPEKLATAKELLQQYGDYDQLTSSGSLVILNNGIEFAATYLLMLLSLLFTGGGRLTSLDYWLARRFNILIPSQ